jgi:esterase/lipase
MKVLLALSLLISLNLFAETKADRDCSCIGDIQDKIDQDNETMSQAYKFGTGTYLKYDNRAQILPGKITDQAIILIHGFIASPFEVKEAAEYLNNMGYTVYMPLLYGFGAEGTVANKGKLKYWREQIKESVKRLSKCYSKISLGGISLGGALATDYVLTTHDKNISNLVLLSPYYDISQSVARLLVGPLTTLKESVDLTTLYSLSHSDDLTEILKNSEFYSNIMPLVTLTELFKLSNELKEKTSSQKLNVPVFVAYSEFDTTIDLGLAQSLPSKHFEKVKYYKLAKDLKVPHQITYAESNPKFKQMMRNISMFISGVPL